MDSKTFPYFHIVIIKGNQCSKGAFGGIIVITEAETKIASKPAYVFFSCAEDSNTIDNKKTAREAFKARIDESLWIRIGSFTVIRFAQSLSYTFVTKNF